MNLLPAVPPPPRSFNPPAPQTLVDVYAKSKTPAVLAKTFLVYGDERLTFGDVFQAADRLASALVHVYGVKRGDRCVDMTTHVLASVIV